jgi:hypothetical protein
MRNMYGWPLLKAVALPLLVVTILIAPYLGILVFNAVEGHFDPIFLYFWYWIPFGMILFPVTVPIFALSLVILLYYISKKRLPFHKPQWIIFTCMLGSILGTLAVLVFLIYMLEYPITGYGELYRARRLLLSGPVTGCITGLMVALLTYKKILLLIQNKESTSSERL